ncbi:uncharacterized protein [Ptychodera flava]|uniref:uncharacterized protein n=1 Tax=Ptychodera flava TaxID=63121 RepID=UPI00396A93B3
MDLSTDFNVSLLKTVKVDFSGENVNTHRQTGTAGEDDGQLSSQDCYYVWEEAARTDRLSSLGDSLEKATIELLKRLRENRLTHKEKSTIVQFLCGCGVLKMHISTAVFAENGTGMGRECVHKNARRKNHNAESGACTTVTSQSTGEDGAGTGRDRVSKTVTRENCNAESGACSAVTSQSTGEDWAGTGRDSVSKTVKRENCNAESNASTTVTSQSTANTSDKTAMSAKRRRIDKSTGQGMIMTADDATKIAVKTEKQKWIVEDNICVADRERYPTCQDLQTNEPTASHQTSDNISAFTQGAVKSPVEMNTYQRQTHNESCAIQQLDAGNLQSLPEGIIGRNLHSLELQHPQTSSHRELLKMLPTANLSQVSAPNSNSSQLSYIPVGIPGFPEVDPMSQKLYRPIKWAVASWENWRNSRNDRCRESQSSDETRGPVPALSSELTASELQFWLCRFVSEVRRQDGSEYPAKTLRVLCCCVQRYLRDVCGRPDLCFMDSVYKSFKEFHRTYKRVINDVEDRAVGRQDQNIKTCCVHDERKLQDKVFFNETAKGLSFAAYFYISKSFEIQSTEDHSHLQAEQFEHGRDEHGEYLQFQPSAFHNRENASNLSRKRPLKTLRRYTDQTNERCGIKCLISYLKYVPSDGPFYRRPLSNAPDGRIRFTTHKVGINHLRLYMRKMCELAELPGWQEGRVYRVVGPDASCQQDHEDQTDEKRFCCEESRDGNKQNNGTGDCEQGVPDTVQPSTSRSAVEMDTPGNDGTGLETSGKDTSGKDVPKMGNPGIETPRIGAKGKDTLEMGETGRGTPGMDEKGIDTP